MLSEEDAGLAPLIDYFFELGSEGGVEDIVLGANGQIVGREMRIEPLVDQLVRQGKGAALVPIKSVVMPQVEPFLHPCFGR